jgi:hypothetical protein
MPKPLFPQIYFQKAKSQTKLLGITVWYKHDDSFICQKEHHKYKTLYKIALSFYQNVTLTGVPYTGDMEPSYFRHDLLWTFDTSLQV